MMANCPVRGKAPGVAAIDYNGDRYCIDCAATVIDGRDISVQYTDDSFETIEDADGEDIVDGLIHGDIYTLGMGGVLLSGAESPHMHCGRHADCEHALSGDEHDYDHDAAIGGRLDLTEIPADI